MARAVAFVRLEHGRFIALVLLKFLDFVEGVNDGDVMLAELFDPFFVLWELDSFFRLVRILLGDG